MILFYKGNFMSNKNSFVGRVGPKARVANNSDLAVDINALGMQGTPTSKVKELVRRKGGGIKPIQANRIGKLQISAFFEKNVKKQFEILCIEREKNQTEMLTEAINDIFRKYGKPPIA